MRQSRIVVTLEAKGGRVEFRPLNMSLFQQVRQMPGRHRWSGNTLMFEDTPANWAWVRRTWPDAEVPQNPAEQLEKRSARPQFEPKMPPYEKQREGLRLAWGKPAFAYFMDMGTGKTKVTLDEALALWSRGLIDGALVIAPNNVHRQWVEEQVPKNVPDAIPVLAHAWKVGKPPEGLLERPDAFRLLAINIEAFRFPKQRRDSRTDLAITEATDVGKLAASFLRSGRMLFVVDESQKVKNPKAGRTQAILALAQLSTVRRILTGTPISTGLADYYTQFAFLDPLILGYRSFFGFRAQYCVMGGFDNKQIIGYQNTEQLHEKLAPYTFRVEKREMLDLPPVVYDTRKVDMTPAQLRAYNQIKDEWLIELSDGSEMDAELAIVRMTRLQQIVQGFLPLPDGGFDRFPSNKPEALDDLIEASPGKIVVWCRFREDVNQLMERYGDAAVRYDGQVNNGERAKSKERFMRDDSCRIFIGNASAGGTGLDGLQSVASTVVYYSNSFSPLDRAQSWDRVERAGLNQSVSVYDLIARNSIDLHLLRSLKANRQISDLSLQEIKQWLM